MLAIESWKVLELIPELGQRTRPPKYCVDDSLKIMTWIFSHPRNDLGCFLHLDSRRCCSSTVRLLLAEILKVLSMQQCRTA